MKRILFVFLLVFFLFGDKVICSQQSIGLIYVENLAGRGPEDLENKLIKIFEELVSASGEFKLLTKKEIEDRIRKQNLSKALEYVTLLGNDNIAQLGKIINVDRIVYIVVTAYDEQLTKDKSIVFIQTTATLIFSDSKTSTDYYASSRVELQEKKAHDKARNNAFREVISHLISQISGKETPPQNVFGEVIGNKKSKMFHMPNVRHIPDEKNSIKFKNIDEAKKEGYSSCPICFPSLLPSTENAGTMELALSSEIGGYIEYYYRTLKDDKLQSYVNKIGEKVVQATPRQNLRFIFTILNSDEINAFAAGAGIVYITKGLLDIIESDDELAGVLAHEVAHNVKRHIVRQYRRDTNLSILGAILSGGEQNIGVAIGRSLIMSGYDRKYEREADMYALIYSIRSGYDPQGYIMLLKKLLDLEKTQPSKLEVYFRSHPPTPERIKRAEEFLAEYNNLIKKLQ